MEHASSASRWYRPWRAPQSRPVIEHDPADLGTCFGLDMSLEDPADTPDVATPVRMPWWARWSAGSRRADLAAD